jgi:CRISPR-associated endonuclease/helicase Cas3
VKYSAKSWLSDCHLLARSAGLTHDVGKAGVDFQEKIRSPTPLVDPVRHEWISLYVIRAMLAGKTWTEAWKSIEEHEPPQERWTNMDPFDKALDGMESVLLYLVATHHKLPTFAAGMNHFNHVRDDDHIAFKKGDLQTSSLREIKASLAEIRTRSKDDAIKDRLYWKSVATISRVALILADHDVSMQMIHEPDDVDGCRLYANTDRETHAMNQSLDWHLMNVGQQADEMVDNFESFSPPCLSEDVVKRICVDNSKKKAYKWQKRAATALSISSKANPIPHLVLNMAATGSGKTRMNVRAVCALGNPDGTNIRISTALNLRTLTLQTRDAYAQQLNIPASELTGIIGDKATLKLHNYQQQKARQFKRAQQAAKNHQNTQDVTDLVDDDENSVEPEFDTVSSYSYHTPPRWLRGFLANKPYMAPVLGAPVLVSTVDFLIAAGEPQMQANHALAMLRLKSSDLILDEIDSYDPMAFLSVMRLVTLSAFFGRNVIASSATLSRPVAKMLWSSFHSGIEMRARKEGVSARFATAIIDDETVPTVAIHRAEKAFMGRYESHTKKMLKKLVGKRYRRATMQEVPGLSEESWMQSVLNSINAMHIQNCWTDPATKRKLSIGLVRIANIHVAVKIAKFLSEAYGLQARIVCYHSQHFMMQRFHIENKLDTLLNRKEGSAHILQDPDIREALDSATTKNVLFIVVATPVEEIGRDHDFDWAVIEPSSIQSLIQTAGRVNRHRMIRLGYLSKKMSKNCDKRDLRRNVAILQYNFRTIVHMHRDAQYRAFCQPGLEMEHAPYPTHNLLEMLDWRLISTEQIDARQRFYDPKIDRRRKEDPDITRRYSFAMLDDASLEAATEDIFARMMTTTRTGNEWMGLNTYLDSPLRERSQGSVNLIWRASEPRNLFLCKMTGLVSNGQLLKMPDTFGRVKNDWLMLDDQQLIAKATAANLVIDDAMRVNLSVGNLRRDGSIAQASLLEYAVHDRSFGFYRNRQR